MLAAMIFLVTRLGVTSNIRFLCFACTAGLNGTVYGLAIAKSPRSFIAQLHLPHK